MVHFKFRTHGLKFAKSLAMSLPSRPFYIIAHECNTLKKINRALRQGANGIECDLWRDEEGRWWVSHDGDDKTDLVAWLQHIAVAENKFRRKLAVLVFDIKTAEPLAPLRQIINAHLPEDLAHVYSVAKLEMAHVFRAIAPLLTHLEAIAVDEEDSPEEVASFFESIPTRRCWYANGITAFIPYNRRYHLSLQAAKPLRDAGVFARIYTWTVVQRAAMKKYIYDDDVDAILVNLRRFFMRPVRVARRIIKKAPHRHLAGRYTPIV